MNDTIFFNCPWCEYKNPIYLNSTKIFTYVSFTCYQCSSHCNGNLINANFNLSYFSTALLFHTYNISFDFKLNHTCIFNHGEQILLLDFIANINYDNVEEKLPLLLTFQ